MFSFFQSNQINDGSTVGLLASNFRMSKRTYESGSSKRNKATAKVHALRALLEKTKPIAQFFNVAEGSSTPVDSSEN